MFIRSPTMEFDPNIHNPVSNLIREIPSFAQAQIPARSGTASSDEGRRDMHPLNTPSHSHHSHTPRDATAEQGRGFAVILGIKRRAGNGLHSWKPGKGRAPRTSLPSLTAPRFLARKRESGSLEGSVGYGSVKGGADASSFFTVTYTPLASDINPSPLLLCSFLRPQHTASQQG